MSLKGWVCAQDEPDVYARGPAAARDPLGQAVMRPQGRAARARASRHRRSATPCCGREHLGAYAPLVGGDPRGARALRREPRAHAPGDRRARPLPADVDRGRVRRRRRDARAAAALHAGVQARADQDVSREGGDRRGCRTRARSTSRISPDSTRRRRTGDGAPRRSVRRIAGGASQRRSRAADAQPYRGQLSRAAGRSSTRAAVAARRTRPAEPRLRATPLAGRPLEVEIDDARRQPPRHADVGRAGPPLCGRQGRGLRHRRQRHSTRAAATARSGSTRARGG